LGQTHLPDTFFPPLHVELLKVLHSPCNNLDPFGQIHLPDAILPPLQVLFIGLHSPLNNF
jgi:hypothetical protein